MEPAFPIPTPGYVTFLSTLAISLQMLATSTASVLEVTPHAESWLALEPGQRTQGLTATWTEMRGYPENSVTDPAENDYVPLLLLLQRARLCQLLREAGAGATLTTANLGQILRWHLPQAYEQGEKQTEQVTSRLIRSLYWLGVVAVDHPELPRHARLTPLGATALGIPTGEGESGVVPEDPLFYLQPNAEVFAPPNLAPRTLFHLRRLTGEKKGGPAGMHPLTTDSLRRALDSGLSVDQVTTFLERFSRTGLPGNVRSLVETTGRQHGRIRLVPAGYVLVADEPALLTELQAVKQVAPYLGKPLTERSMAVETDQVSELMKKLRGRGYAPVDTGEGTQVPPLPEDPTQRPEPPRGGTGRTPTLLLAGVPDAAEEAGSEPGTEVTEPAAIESLLDQAVSRALEVEIQYRDRAQEVTALTICPLTREGRLLEAYVEAVNEDYEFDVSGILSARLTGRPAPDP